MVRLVSGLVLAAAALAAILFLPLVALQLVACGVAALAADEYLRIIGTRRPITHATLVALATLACWWIADRGPIDVVVIVFVILGWIAVEMLFEGRTVHDAAADLVAPVYVGVPLGMLVAAHALCGWRVTLMLIGTVVISDSAQYYSGRMFGRQPLAPTISPKKTVEGAIGGVVFGVLFTIVAGMWALPGSPVLARVLLGAALVIVGIMGDLFESRLKRVAGVKDSSALIPGHGGVLDRIDALLFTAPVFYFALVRIAS